jgi:molecular chaperone DnaK
VFSTAEDNQSAVTVHVLQGEREQARFNKSLAKFDLAGIQAAARGTPQIEVTFDIDANGILHVTAKDKATGKEQKIRVEASSGLSDAEIKRMVDDAEKNSQADKQRREEIDTRNRLDSLTYEVEKNSKEWSDRLSPDLKTRLDAAVERSRKALRGDDMAEIRAAQEELTAAFQEAGRSFYAQQQETAAPPTGEPAAEQPAGASAGQKADDVVEADYEIVDEGKK